MWTSSTKTLIWFIQISSSYHVSKSTEYSKWALQKQTKADLHEFKTSHLLGPCFKNNSNKSCLLPAHVSRAPFDWAPELLTLTAVGKQERQLWEADTLTFSYPWAMSNLQTRNSLSVKNPHASLWDTREVKREGQKTLHPPEVARSYGRAFLKIIKSDRDTGAGETIRWVKWVSYKHWDPSGDLCDHRKATLSWGSITGQTVATLGKSKLWVEWESQ